MAALAEKLRAVTSSPRHRPLSMGAFTQTMPGWGIQPTPSWQALYSYLCKRQASLQRPRFIGIDFCEPRKYAAFHIEEAAERCAHRADKD